MKFTKIKKLPKHLCATCGKVKEVEADTNCKPCQLKRDVKMTAIPMRIVKAKNRYFADEDVKKYATDEEKEFLKESFVRDVKIKAREFLERLTGVSDWSLRAKTWGDPFGYGGHVVVKVEGFPWKKYGVFVRELKNLAKKAGFSFDFDADVTSYDSATGEEGEGWFAEGMGTREKAKLVQEKLHVEAKDETK
jgi:hypothetical protein